MKREKNNRSKWRDLIFFFLLVMLALLSGQHGFAQSSEPSEQQQSKLSEEQRPEPSEEAGYATFGSPDAVQNRIESDLAEKDALFELEFMKPYYAWKERLKEEYGYSFGAEYSSVYLKASDSLPGADDDAASGMFRFSGFWELLGRGTDHTGTLVYLVEHRHRYTDTAPSEFSLGNLGNVGVISAFFNDNEWQLTKLHWNQELNDGQFEVVAGFLDITDFVDVFALTSPWTDFSNLAFSIGAATLDAPDNAALGLAVGAYLSDNIYTIAGFQDLNSDPTDPLEGFDTFWNDHEFFKHIEIGWTTSRERLYLDNVHLTLWHADQRDETEKDDGWGAILSFTHTIGEQWLVFARGGYANDGASLLQKSVSAGGGYRFSTGGVLPGSQLGFGVNWGQPNDNVFGSDLDDQYTTEVYCRVQVTKELAITPDVQLLINPALKPEKEYTWVFGLRARLSF